MIIHLAFEFYSPEEVRKSTGSKVFRMVRKPIPPPQLLSAVSAAVAELESRRRRASKHLQSIIAASGK